MIVGLYFPDVIKFDFPELIIAAKRKKIKICSLDNIKSSLISLEDFELPLYTPTLEENFKEES